MLSCAIIDARTSGPTDATLAERVADQVRRWAAAGITLVQLRQKELAVEQRLRLAEAALRELREANASTRLLINSRADIALAARAHGVHLTAHRDELTPQQVRQLFARAELPSPVISVSCHTAEEVIRARDNAADYILFGPVFEKRVDGALVSAGAGLDALHRACDLAQGVPVLALGGVTTANAPACLAAGAAGIAGIRTFL